MNVTITLSCEEAVYILIQAQYCNVLFANNFSSQFTSLINIVTAMSVLRYSPKVTYVKWKCSSLDIAERFTVLININETDIRWFGECLYEQHQYLCIIQNKCFIVVRAKICWSGDISPSVLRTERFCPASFILVYWTVHHCNSWRMKDQLDVTCYFISLMCSTCFGH
jgi:hypothetical protein